MWSIIKLQVLIGFQSQFYFCNLYCLLIANMLVSNTYFLSLRQQWPNHLFAASITAICLFLGYNTNRTVLSSSNIECCNYSKHVVSFHTHFYTGKHNTLRTRKHASICVCVQSSGWSIVVCDFQTTPRYIVFSKKILLTQIKNLMNVVTHSPTE